MFRSILKWGAISLAALIVLTTVFGGGETTATPTTDTAQAETKLETKTTETKMTKPKPQPKPKPKPSMTGAQEEAMESAESYLDSGQFSRKGLADQLKYEEYPAADIRFAINHVKADYMAEAVEAAESYLDSGSFSRSGLADQLKYEEYTPAQIQHAVSKAYR